MRIKESGIAVLTAREQGSSERCFATIVTVVGLSSDGAPRVQTGPTGSALTARLAFSCSPQRLLMAIEEQHQAVAVFENGEPDKPVLLGLLERPSEIREGTVCAETEPAPLESAAGGEESVAVEADADGRRVRVTAQDEIVLQCGKASITLRRNGRVIVRGTYVETHSEGTNRIKGGQVQIN